MTVADPVTEPFPGALLRRVREDEGEAYAELVRAAYGSDPESRELFRAATETPEAAAARLRAHPTWALELEGSLVAACSARLPWSGHPGPWPIPHLGWIVAHPDHRGRGLATAVTEGVLSVLRDDFRAPAVSLGTAREHSRLPGYYERRGWVPVEDRDLGLGHITRYFIRELDAAAFAGRRAALGIPDPSTPKGTS